MSNAHTPSGRSGELPGEQTPRTNRPVKSSIARNDVMAWGGASDEVIGLAENCERSFVSFITGAVALHGYEVIGGKVQTLAIRVRSLPLSKAPMKKPGTQPRRTTVASGSTIPARSRGGRRSRSPILLFLIRLCQVAVRGLIVLSTFLSSHIAALVPRVLPHSRLVCIRGISERYMLLTPYRALNTGVQPFVACPNIGFFLVAGFFFPYCWSPGF